MSSCWIDVIGRCPGLTHMRLLNSLEKVTVMTSPLIFRLLEEK